MIIGKSSARVDITEFGTSRLPASEILAQLLARSSRDVNVDPAAFTESDTLERRLRSLHSHSLLYRRDTGIDGLYLGFPFLLMHDPRANTKPRIAPVLLWPVRINPEVGNRGHVTLGFGRDHGGDRDPDQVILNPAFEGLMGFEGARRWQEAADDLLSRASISVADAMDAFGTLAASRGDTLSCSRERTSKSPLQTGTRSFGRPVSSGFHGTGHCEGPGSSQRTAACRDRTGNGTAPGRATKR